MNVFTVGKATQGLANYLNGTFHEPSVCIAFDTRNMSLEFALTAVQVLCANGVRVFRFDDQRAEPEIMKNILQFIGLYPQYP